MTLNAKNTMVLILERYYEVNRRQISFDTYHTLSHGEDERVMKELFQDKYIRIIEKKGQTIYVIYLEDSFFRYFGVETPN